MAAVSIAPEVIFNINGLKVTNSILATLLVDFVLISIIYKIRADLSPVPGKLQTIVESVISYFYSLTEQISGKFVDVIFPWFASFFIFIFASNIIGLLPGFGTIGFFQEEHGKEVFIPILRAVTSDFNATFALAIISLVATHILSIKYNGIFSYLKRFFSLNPIFLFVGILELVSEVTKVISLSFRLFGNIYAGEVVLHTISSLFAFVAPIPFLLLESIVALVQALVFSMLTMVFMTILITPHSEGGEH
ncbi:MAG: ATP synthase F0 subunit A [Candidatus Levybacteria bacterium RIFCSPHIGHO2_02_FULL_39_36]|nr:MAG: ATP synthase subunit a [Candidatus Levybacteria bacterium GW2011_GWA1_39_11]KKR25205.1 MAG: ATP synthase subunit a [Candidatus Levybacteria bacterium GW2011_GWB1_39_7]KKR25731.1 MAG: ATP synthase subunit a [Microgenomates group bacterium GW2011_GWC1_39_7]KKR49617.1 MAG: ATP synthase subunit a [Candidatus Levybacteria bacterium GW2011_GWA2_40_16]OGH15512.1 MAG: ATP synthase F0 subunit A [Candidatus Levybacteria bacterium RIFCSPHIGHO2_01_FULL_38_96]OGH25385.1 MAG: ATP synthase F0 subunit